MKKVIKGILVWALNSAFILTLSSEELRVLMATGTVDIIGVLIIYLLWGVTSMIMIKAMCNTKSKKETKSRYLTYAFIDNSILLKTETLLKNGFQEVWRQENEETHSIQILCFNPEKQEFQAFDRFHWVGEPRIIQGECVDRDGVYYKEELWTPIRLNYTTEWLQKKFQQAEI